MDCKATSGKVERSDQLPPLKAPAVGNTPSCSRMWKDPRTGLVSTSVLRIVRAQQGIRDTEVLLQKFAEALTSRRVKHFVREQVSAQGSAPPLAQFLRRRWSRVEGKYELLARKLMKRLKGFFQEETQWNQECEFDFLVCAHALSVGIAICQGSYWHWYKPELEFGCGNGSAGPQGDFDVLVREVATDSSWNLAKHWAEGVCMAGDGQAHQAEGRPVVVSRGGSKSLTDIEDIGSESQSNSRNSHGGSRRRKTADVFQEGRDLNAIYAAKRKRCGDLNLYKRSDCSKCRKHCPANCGNLPVEVILHERDRVKDMKAWEKREFMCKALLRARVLKDGTPTYGTLNLGGHSICVPYLSYVYLMGNSTFSQLYLGVLAEGEQYDHRSKSQIVNPKRDPPPINLIVKEWITDHFRCSGDCQPRDKEIHLEPYTTKDLMNTMKAELEVASDFPIPPMSRQRFAKICNSIRAEGIMVNGLRMKIKFRIRKKVGMCSTCFSLREKLMATRIREEKQMILKDIEDHQKLQSTLRRMYYRRRERARNSEDEECFITDAMDGMKTVIPSFFKYDKRISEQVANLFKIKLQGTIIHGRHINFRVCMPWISLGADLVCTCLYLGILEEEKSKSFGPEWHFQLDGASDNWCITTMAFMGWLVLNGTAKSITMHRLLVGHTHEDIDQLFSLLSEYMNGRGLRGAGHDILTMEELRESIPVAITGGGGMKKAPKVGELWETYGFTEWLKPCVDPKFGSHKHVLCVCLFLHGNAVHFKYKNMDTDEHWLPADRPNGFPFFMKNPTGQPVKNKPTMLYKNGNLQWEPGKVRKAVQTVIGIKAAGRAIIEKWDDLFQECPTPDRDTIPNQHQLEWQIPQKCKAWECPAMQQPTATNPEPITFTGNTKQQQERKDLLMSDWQGRTDCKDIAEGNYCLVLWGADEEITKEEKVPPVCLAKITQILEVQKSRSTRIRIRWHVARSYACQWKPITGRHGLQEINCESIVYYGNKEIMLTKQNRLRKRIKDLMQEIDVCKFDYYCSEDVAEEVYAGLRSANEKEESSACEQEEDDLDAEEAVQCAVCQNGVGTAKNPIICCSRIGCEYACHVGCYRWGEIPQRAIEEDDVEWLCHQCSY